MILIGSRALIVHFPDYPIAPKSDYDIISTPKEFEFLQSKVNIQSCKKNDIYDKYRLKIGEQIPISVEIDTTENKSNKLLEGYVKEKKDWKNIEVMGLTISVPPPVILYLTKLSHAHFPIHIEKTFRDIIFMQRKNLHEEISPYMLKYHEQRKKEIEERVARKTRVNLNKSNEDFFAPSQRIRKYVHDDLHKAVAYFSEPMYERCKYNKNKAKIERELFEQLPTVMKLMMVREEAMVIALERLIIPGKEENPNKAFHWAIKKLILDLTTGWFREYILNNLYLLENPDVNYVKKFRNALSDGAIRLIE